MAQPSMRITPAKMNSRPSPNPSPGRAENYLVVRIGGYEFVIPCAMVRRLMRQPEFFPLPSAPRWCGGMLSLPELTLPALNLGHLLHLTVQDPPPVAVVVEPGLSVEFPQFALPVDRLTITTSIQAHEWLSIRAGSSLPFRQHVSAAWRERSRPCYRLRMESLIPVNELHLLPALCRSLLY